MTEATKTVGRYEMLHEVGRGGMAAVYLARQIDLDRFVALKELGAFHASDPTFAQRFLRESRLAGSLIHPNIVTVFDYFEHDGTPYIAMEYVERGSLRPYVGRLSLAQIGGVLEGILAGLDARRGAGHRASRPQARERDGHRRGAREDRRLRDRQGDDADATGAFLTATGTTVGTPTYMAPEQAMAQEIGPWTDLYSVGCMAFELFSGRSRSTTPTRRWRSCCGTSTSRPPPQSRAAGRRSGDLGLDRAAAGQGPRGADPERRSRLG